MAQEFDTSYLLNLKLEDKDETGMHFDIEILPSRDVVLTFTEFTDKGQTATIFGPLGYHQFRRVISFFQNAGEISL